MKKLIILIIVAFYNLSTTAQHEPALRVGDLAPALCPLKWIKGDSLVGFQKGKIYVVEFGATWCAPCAAAIPVLSSLAKKHGSSIDVVSLFVMESQGLPKNSTAYVGKVERYVAKKSAAINYRVAVDTPDGALERTWLSAAGLSGIPHIFVIDKTGRIAWIGSDPNKVSGIIERLQSDGHKVNPDTQAEVNPSFDHFKLLLIEGNGGNESDFLFRSILTRYDGKIKAGNPGFIHSFSWVDSTSEYNKYKNRVQVIGANIAQLYYLAYGDTVQNAVHFRNINWEFPDTVKHPHLKTSYGKLWHEPILEVTDHAPFKWSKTSPVNRFNYSLKVPEGTGHAWYLQAAMRNDLDTYFGYSVTVETRQMPYWRLSAPDKKGALQKLKSLDQSKKLNIRDMDYPFEYQNAVMQDVITFLGGFYGYGSMDFGKLPKSEQSAFIDETGITDKIDFTLDRRMSFEEIRMHLKTLGLELTKAYKPFRVVVIRNPQETSLH